jgi:hypothetical protein
MMLKQDHFYNFKYHAYVEPCNFFDSHGSFFDFFDLVFGNP